MGGLPNGDPGADKLRDLDVGLLQADAERGDVLAQFHPLGVDLDDFLLKLDLQVLDLLHEASHLVLGGLQPLLGRVGCPAATSSGARLAEQTTEENALTFAAAEQAAEHRAGG